MIFGLSTTRQIWVALEAVFGNSSIEQVHNLRDQILYISKGYAASYLLSDIYLILMINFICSFVVLGQNLKHFLRLSALFALLPRSLTYLLGKKS